MSYQVQKSIKRILYRLKRVQGVKIDIYEVIGNGQDYETGEMTRDYNVWTVKRAILFPESQDRKYSYDLTFLAANKNFQMGGLYEVGIRRMIIDRADLPTNFEIRQHYHIIHNRDRYEIEAIQFYEVDKFYLLTLRDTKARRPEQVITESASSTLDVSDTYEGET